MYKLIATTLGMRSSDNLMDAYCLTRLNALRRKHTERNTALTMDAASAVRPWTVAAAAMAYRTGGTAPKRADSGEVSGRFFGTADELVVAMRRPQLQSPD